MRPKFLVIVLIASAFYIIGARAGRPRYEQIKNSAAAFWNDPTVKKARAETRKEAAKARKAAEKKADQLHKKLR